LLSRSLNILFRNLYFMNLILKTKYTLSIEYWVCSSASTRQQPLAYQSGTTRNREWSHPTATIDYILWLCFSTRFDNRSNRCRHICTLRPWWRQISTFERYICSFIFLLFKSVNRYVNIKFIFLTNALSFSHSCFWDYWRFWIPSFLWRRIWHTSYGLCVPFPCCIRYTTTRLWPVFIYLIQHGPSIIGKHRPD
jgi:hypothetical protein